MAKNGKKIKRVTKLRPQEASLHKMLHAINFKFYVLDGGFTPLFSDDGKEIIYSTQYEARISSYYAAPTEIRTKGINPDGLFTGVYPEIVGVTKYSFDEGGNLVSERKVVSDLEKDIEDYKAKNNRGINYNNSWHLLINNTLSFTSFNHRDDVLVSTDFVNRWDKIYEQGNFYNGFKYPGVNAAVSRREDNKNKPHIKRITLPYLIERHPENDTGIIVWKVVATLNVPEGKTEPEIGFETISYFEITPGVKQSKAYNVRKTGDFETTLEDILNIKNGNGLYFNGMTGLSSYAKGTYSYSAPSFTRNALLEFYEAFPNFTKRTGMDVSSALATTWGLTDYVTNYLFLIAEFPVIEQLVKMSYWRLVQDIMNSLAVPKYKRREICESIANIISSDATSGKKGIKLPTWMSAYMNDHMVTYKDIQGWSNLHEACSFTKESFEAFVKSSEYKLARVVNTNIIPELAKVAVFGYEPLKTIKYANKQSQIHSFTIPDALRDLFDYARMCDVMGIQPDLYPKNIHEVHDKMVTSFKAYQNAALDGNIARRKREISPALTALKKLKVYEDSEYDIIIPENSHDIIDEGQQQRNCVGSYVRNVADGSSTIFFVRNRESLGQSYVTVEYRNGYMTQCFYAANRHVDRNSDEARLANAFCEEIKKLEAKKNNAVA